LKLAIFDIDGTLADTNKVDHECFLQAIREEFALELTDFDCSDYVNVTDSGIAQAIYRNAFERLPSTAELVGVKKRFVALLRNSFNASPASFRQVPGATATLNRFLSDAQWSASFATGCWSEAAILKLNCASLPWQQIPLTTSDDAIDRCSLLTKAIERARHFYGVRQFERIVSIGDAAWDAHAASLLQIPFIGIGRSSQSQSEGKIFFVENYDDTDGFFRLLESASVPQNIAENAHFA
jgi:phosphoglycolate phosphatase-like HAD superfamily hydrolase